MHSHTPKAGLVAMIAAFFARVPTRFHTVAGLPLLETKGVKRKILSQVECLTYAFSTKVYPNSKELKKIILQENFCKESKLKVIENGSSNGIDLSYFDPETVSEEEKRALKKELSIEENDFVFIFLGRLVRDKGINELVSAFKSIVEEKVSCSYSESELESSTSEGGVIIPLQIYEEETGNAKTLRKASGASFYSGASISGLDLRYRLGKAIYRSKTDNYDSENGIEDSGPPRHSAEYKALSNRFPNVKLLLVGPMEQELNPILGITLSEITKNSKIIPTDYVQDVRPYFAISNCLVFPSYREGFPNAVLQAGAMGLPSIVSDINGCNEIITDDDNGIIIPAKDEKSLKEAMRKMLVETDVLEGLKLNTRKTIVDKYSQEKVWQELLAEYQAITEK